MFYCHSTQLIEEKLDFRKVNILYNSLLSFFLHPHEIDVRPATLKDRIEDWNNDNFLSLVNFERKEIIIISCLQFYLLKMQVLHQFHVDEERSKKGIIQDINY
jgi:hypothetical protein